MAQTYLDIVNSVVDETKVTLDHLTSANFDNPPRTTMYNRFKAWVNMAYKELLLDHPEWMFRTERGVQTIWPRIMVTGLNYIPSVGDILIGQISGVEVTVVGLHTFEASERSGALEYTLSVIPTEENTLGNLLLNEALDREEPTVDTAVGYFKGVGAYNFTDVDSNVDDIQEISVRTSKIPEDAADDGGTYGSNSYPVQYIDWDYWDYYQRYPWNGDRPQYMTRGPEGNYYLWPQPSSEQLLTFTYSRTIPKLEAWDDSPDGLPEKFVDYLVWRTVQEYADFDQQSKLFMRASKHVDRYLLWLARDEIKDIKVATWLNNRR